MAWLIRRLGSRALSEALGPALPVIQAAASDPVPTVQAQGLWALHHISEGQPHTGRNYLFESLLYVFMHLSPRAWGPKRTEHAKFSAGLRPLQDTHVSSLRPQPISRVFPLKTRTRVTDAGGAEASPDDLRSHRAELQKTTVKALVACDERAWPAAAAAACGTAIAIHGTVPFLAGSHLISRTLLVRSWLAVRAYTALFSPKAA